MHPDWMKMLWDMLTQFTGGRGGIDHTVVNYGIAAIFYAVLFLVARTKNRNTLQPQENLLMWGFGIGLSRELFMIIMAAIQATGLADPVELHKIFPPLEHALLYIAMILIAGGYLGYFLDKPTLTRRYLQAGISATALTYMATFWWWAGYIEANPTSKFGKVWCDWLFHINASFWLFLAAILMFQKASLRTRNLVTLSLCLFAVSEFLKLPDMALDEVYEYIFTPISRLIYLSAIFMLGYVYILEEISKRNQTLRALQKSEAQLRQSESNLAITLNSIGDAVISTDAAGLITHMNPTAERLTGWPLAEALSQPLTAVFRIINALTHLPSVNPVDLVMERGEVVGLANHTALLARDGREYQIADSGAPIRNEAGQIVGVVLVFSDVTEKYRVEEALRASETRFRAIVENEPECVKLVGANGKLLEMNAAGLAMLEANSLAEVQAFGLAEFLLPQYRADFLALHQSTMAGNQGKLEFEVIGLLGTRRRLETHAVPLRDANGHITMMLGITRDITARKQADQALQDSLKEKTALLNEVHHRVKNNLQIITSLLRLESGRSVEPGIKAVLSDMQGRIRSMALLHETLYRSGTFAEIDLGTYLKQLATQSFRALQLDDNAIHLQLKLDSVKVGMDQATPCGLLVNELISNSLKHGFPNGRAGEITIQLQPTADSQQWCLRVSDSGVGLPADFEARQQNSLGLQLVSSLAIQIGGSLTIRPGAAFTVTFPVIAPAPTAMEVSWP